MTPSMERARGVSPAVARSAIALELAVIALLAAAFLVVFRGRPGHVDLALALAAVGLIGLGYRRSARLWAEQPPPAASRYAERMRRASARTGAFTLPVAASFFVFGFVAGYAAEGWSGALDRVGNPYVLAAFLLYLPWALLQQFVFQFYLLARLLYLLPLPGAIVLNALAFSLVHYPRVPVMILTCVGGAAWALLYRRYRSLVPLAVSHAILGAALHYWVFGRDLLDSWVGGLQAGGG